MVFLCIKCYALVDTKYAKQSWGIPFFLSVLRFAQGISEAGRFCPILHFCCRVAFCEAMEEAEMNPSEKLATSFKVIWFTCVGKGAIVMQRRTEYTRVGMLRCVSATLCC